MNFHVISHTHWDREWHQTYQQYRVRLIRFMDELLELLETSPAYTSFLLDGQTIVIEDYLEIKPKNRDRHLFHFKFLQIGKFVLNKKEIKERVKSSSNVLDN